MSDRWQRIHLTFEPRLLADIYSVRFESKQSCDIYLDAMQVAPADEQTGGPIEFAAQTPYEVALQVPASEASAARVQFDDEAAALNFCVTSTEPIPGATLHAQGAAIAALAQQIEDHHFERRNEVAEGVWAYVFGADDGSKSVAILSPETTHEEYRLPVGALDLFGNPIPEGTPMGKTVCYLPLADGVGVETAR